MRQTSQIIGIEDQMGLDQKTRTQIRKWLDFFRLMLAGSLGGIAVVNTVALFQGTSVSSSAETIGMTSGAVVLAAIVKALHIV